VGVGDEADHPAQPASKAGRFRQFGALKSQINPHILANARIDPNESSHRRTAGRRRNGWDARTAVPHSYSDRQTELRHRLAQPPDTLDSAHIGIKNVHDRIQFYFGDKYVEIDSVLGAVTTVTLRVPAV
jgi:sensor histidine kinase YesM